VSIYESVDLWSFRLISELCGKVIFTNIDYMPPVIFLHALISNENPHKSADSSIIWILSKKGVVREDAEAGKKIFGSKK